MSISLSLRNRVTMAALTVSLWSVLGILSSCQETGYDPEGFAATASGQSVVLYYPEIEDSYLIMNLRSGPDAGYPKVGGIEPSDAFTVVGRNAEATWLLVENGGWVAARNVQKHCTPAFEKKTLPVLSETRSRWTIETKGVTEAAGLDLLFNLMAADGMFNGCVIAARDGEIILQGAFGYASFRTREPLQEGSVFELASVTKQFTAMAIMILREQGKLGYDDKLSGYFPDLPPCTRDITLRHLLTHTSGLMDYVNEYHIPDARRAVEDPLSIIKSRKELNFAPGEKYRYCNSGYWLLGRIIEKTSEKPYWAFMRDQIFGPIGMDNTYAAGDPALAEARVVCGIQSEKYMEIDARRSHDMPYPTTGDRGVLSCVEDLFKWDQALNTEQLVGAATLAEAFSPGRLNDGSLTEYGFGWDIESGPEGKRMRHGGHTGGFQSWIERHPDERVTLIVLSNKIVMNGFNSVLDGVKSIAAEEQFEVPVALISDKLFKVIMDGGRDRLEQEFDSLKTNHSAEYVFSEELLYHVGRLFLGGGCVDEARAVFDLAVKEYPESGISYWMLGEIYLQHEDRPKAVAYLQKALELEPHLDTVRQVIESLED